MPLFVKLIMGQRDDPVGGALTALPKEPGSLPQTHMVATNTLTLVQGIRHPSLASVGTRHSCGAQSFMQAKHPYT